MVLYYIILYYIIDNIHVKLGENPPIFRNSKLLCPISMVCRHSIQQPFQVNLIEVLTAEEQNFRLKMKAPS